MRQTPKKIYFAADAHLGNRYLTNPMEMEKKLVRWLDSIKDDAQAIFFLGDMFDYWYEYKYVVSKGHVRFLGKLAELADRGIEIHLMIGNHDIWMFDYLPDEIGVIIHKGPLTIDLLGARFLLAHGSEVGKHKFSFRFLQAMFHNKVCQFLYAGIHPRWTFGFARRWSYNSRKKGLPKMSEDSGKVVGYLIEYASQYLLTHPDIRFFIFGHIHKMYDCALNLNTRLLVVGDWMQLFSYIQWDGNDLILRQFDE